MVRRTPTKPMTLLEAISPTTRALLQARPARRGKSRPAANHPWRTSLIPKEHQKKHEKNPS
jgi:hypothetical protein